MGLNNKIKERFEAIADISKNAIINAILEGRRKQHWTDFLSENSINYKAVVIQENRLEIIRMPSLLTPFRAYGKITIDMEEIEMGKTHLKCEILPCEGYLPLVLGLLIGFFSLLTFIPILTTGNWGALIITIPGLVIFGLVIYLGLLYTKYGLRIYLKRLIAEITQHE